MNSVRIVEVGPRDGLQNESVAIPTSAKAQFVRDLRTAGMTEIEATSFVSPKAVPQLADAKELMAMLDWRHGLTALVPNMRGLESALASGISSIAVFTAASDAFTLANIRMSVEESLQGYEDIVERFRVEQPSGRVRAYVSTAFECPYAGEVPPSSVLEVVRKVYAMGVDEIAISDTIGVAVPAEVRTLAGWLRGETDVPDGQIAWHFHDTHGTAIANVSAALDLGYRCFDSSAGGLGGCPYAPGARGNLATEDLVYFVERQGLKTGVDLAKVSQASVPILKVLGRSPLAKAQLAQISWASQSELA